MKDDSDTNTLNVMFDGTDEKDNTDDEEFEVKPNEVILQFLKRLKLTSR